MSVIRNLRSCLNCCWNGTQEIGYNETRTGYCSAFLSTIPDPGDTSCLLHFRKDLPRSSADRESKLNSNQIPFTISEESANSQVLHDFLTILTRTSPTHPTPDEELYILSMGRVLIRNTGIDCGIKILRWLCPHLDTPPLPSDDFRVFMSRLVIIGDVGYQAVLEGGSEELWGRLRDLPETILEEEFDDSQRWEILSPWKEKIQAFLSKVALDPVRP